MKESIFFLLILSFAFNTKAQPTNCVFKKPFFTMHFGTDNVRDVNTAGSVHYERVPSSCPTDGHYAFTSYTSDCFRGDWHTLTEDHTAADISGNMLVVNSSYYTGAFLKTTASGFKAGTMYEFGVWLMNVCRITEKCPFPLLPDITIRLQTGAGKIIGQFDIGEVARTHAPSWKQYTIAFTMPASETSLSLIMVNNNPGGCGNDFALDDITFRECIKQTPVIATTAKKPIVTKKPVSTNKPVVTNKPNATKQPVVTKKQPTSSAVSKTPGPAPVKRAPDVQIVKPQKDSQVYSTPVIKPKPRAFPKPPPVLTSRTNDVVKQIVTDAGEIKINLYDNGVIDGDTVSVYHNNVLVMSRARLSQKPISLSVVIDETQPYHEFVMVAENLGSIPPNTSLMIITAGGKRYEEFISSNEQRNAKVILRLKE